MNYQLSYKLYDRCKYIVQFNIDDSNSLAVTVRRSIDKSKALSLLVHCADISHPAKNWNLHSRWTNLLTEEFFKQVFFS